MLQMSGVGPMFGQFNHFVRFAPQESYALSRYTSETRRLYDLLDARLAATPYLGGDEYSIADITTFPWIRVEAKLFGVSHKVMRRGWDDHPAIARWFAAIEGRPAVQRALAEIDTRPSTLLTATENDLNRYFGRQEFQRTLG